METVFSISTDDILRRVYALSALRTYTNHTEREVPLLTSDNRAALAMMAANAFADLVLRLMPHVSECTLPGDDRGDLMQVTVDIPVRSGAVVSAMRLTMENLLAYLILAGVWEGEDAGLSKRYRDLAESATSHLRHLAEVGDVFTTTIKPHY